MEQFRDADSAEYVIPANDFINFPQAGHFVHCFESTDALEIGFNNQGGRMYFAAGITRRAPGLAEFESFQLYNETGADITVTVGAGFGDITDNRFAVSGNVPVENAPGDTLKVDDDETQAAIAALQTAVTDLMKNADDQRAAVVPLGSSVVGASNVATVTTLISPASNTAGLWIRTASLSTVDGGAGENNASIMIDTTAPSGHTDTGAHHILVAGTDEGKTLPQPLFVEAGKGVYVDWQGNDPDSICSVSYDLA